MIEVLWILIITSMACSLLGVFLVIRNMAMLSDAVSHSVLLGIVLAYFVVKDLSSIFLIVSASAAGVISCVCMEWLAKSKRISKDSAIGIVFTLFFSIAVILISKFAKNVHLDVDMVLMGELILAPFDRMRFLGISVPKSMVIMGCVFILNAIYLRWNFRTLVISSFDEVFAKTAGISMAIMYYVYISMVSMTAVAAFHTVGAILAISFFIAPAASAFLITKKIKMTVLVSLIYAIINSIVSYFLSLKYNVSMSGMCAGVSGLSFLLTLVFYKDGILISTIRRHRGRIALKNMSYKSLG